MSMQSTREQLTQLLDDQENKVVALSGKWGTGKSFIWEQIQKDSTNPRVKGALFTSLFGLSDLDRVKLKLIQSAVPILEKDPPLLEAVKQFIKSTIKALEGTHKSFSAINDVGLIFAPAVLREKLIVLDDIERKHDNLNIDELLGFIDEFTKRFNTRFLLILNSDQLNRREIWEKLREKVIDEELRLTTSCDEAFTIALSLTPSSWSKPIAEATKKCNLTNIRIIRKIIKTVNRVIGERSNVPDAVLMKVIPSTVLLSAIHYKGIENGPDINFVLSSGRTINLTSLSDSKKTEKTEDQKRQAQWQALITSLGIGYCGKFELLVVEYLQSGQFDISNVKAIIDGYIAEQKTITTEQAVNTFIKKCFWDHHVSEPELLREAHNLTINVDLLNAYTVSAFARQLEELAGGQSLAEEVIEQWLNNYKSQGTSDNSLYMTYRNDFHPRIKALLEEAENRTQADMTVFEACEYIATNSGWNTRHEIALKLATVESFESTIRTASPSNLQLFMIKMLDFTSRPERYEHDFGSAIKNFVSACRRIKADPSVPRLYKILRHLFDEMKLSHLLDNTEETELSELPAPKVELNFGGEN